MTLLAGRSSVRPGGSDGHPGAQPVASGGDGSPPTATCRARTLRSGAAIRLRPPAAPAAAGRGTSGRGIRRTSTDGRGGVVGAQRGISSAAPRARLPSSAISTSRSASHGVSGPASGSVTLPGSGGVAGRRTRRTPVVDDRAEPGVGRVDVDRSGPARWSRRRVRQTRDAPRRSA